MKERIRRICETILLLFCSVQCGRAIYARYAEFLGKGKIVPSFILIIGILLFGTLFTAVLIWKTECLDPLIRLKASLPFLRRIVPLNKYMMAKRQKAFCRAALRRSKTAGLFCHILITMSIGRMIHGIIRRQTRDSELLPCYK